MENAKDLIQEQALGALQTLGIQDDSLAEEVAESILRQAVYWERPLSGERLLFVRLFSPVVMREEVFLGNVLFNDFLSKAFARAVARAGGQAVPVANDLENYYFLARTGVDLSALAAEFRAEVNDSLPKLFFGEPDPQRGIYGDLRGMFTFRKSDFEPFPVYAVPEFLADPLEKAVRREIGKLLQPAAFDGRTVPRTAMAALAFFYGRTSGGAGDAQSFANFADHLVNKPDYDGLLRVDEVTRAFNISQASKQLIKQSVDDETFGRQELMTMLDSLLGKFAASIDSGSDKWWMGYLRRSNKLIAANCDEYVALLLGDVQLGFFSFPRKASVDDLACRLCHTAAVTIQDSYIVSGLTSFKFHNQSVRGIGEKLCARCALYAYLAQKLLGTEMVSAGGKLPQVPKTYNLIFHYGKHSDAEVAQLAQQMDHVWELVAKHRQRASVHDDIARSRKQLAQKLEQERDARKRAALAKDLAQKEAELQEAQTAVTQLENDIYADCPWMRDLDESPVPSENPALDIVGNLQLSESKVERHVLGLGMAGYRLILFVLPQIRAPRDKERDFAQGRFSNSWITVTAFLSFLNHLCGCDGPFYYQSLPTLTPEAFQPGMFYVRDRAVRSDEVQRKYDAVYDLAWKLVWQRGPEGLVKKVVLAEKLLTDPLGTFSAVMRDSPILGQKGGEYKRLRAEYRSDWGAQDLTEYARFIQRLAEL